MKQKHDINPLALIIIALVISFVISVMFLGGAFSKTLDYMQTEAYFEKYKEELIAIKDYVLTVDEFNISRRGVVPECDVSGDISYLLHRSECKSIAKNGNTLEFHLWSKNMDVGGGIAYCESGEMDANCMITQCEALPKSGWYYYVSDFNEWREMQQKGR